MFKNRNKIKDAAKKRRQSRTRAKIFGTAKHPRLNVTKSLNNVYLQLIDDENGKTLASLHSKTLKTKGNKSDIARAAGVALAKLATEKKITSCVFDRAGSVYHGRIKSVAEGAREGGLKF